MSRYYSYNDFMNDVIGEADRISNEKKGYGLEELYHVKINTINAITSLISKDWTVFAAVVILLGVGPLLLGISIATFLTTPIGLAVAAVLGGGTVAIITQMYKDRVLPQNVKKIGEKYKPEWSRIEGNRVKIDLLTQQAAMELYSNALNDLWH